MGTAADVASMQDVLMISAEAGELTLDPNEPGHNFRNIDSVRVKDYKTVARVHDFLRLHASQRDLGTPESEENLWRLQRQLLDQTGTEDDNRLRKYRTVIIDSLTEVEQYCMNQLMGINDQTKIDEESNAPEWAEYRKQHTMVQRLIRNFRDLPMHVLFTCARQYREDEMKRSIYSPMMTGKLANQVQGFMDMVGYLVMGQPKEDGSPAARRLYVQPGPRFAAKSRFSRYRSQHFDDPSLGSILFQVGLIGETELPEALRKQFAKGTSSQQPKA